MILCFWVCLKMDKMEIPINRSLDWKNDGTLLSNTFSTSGYRRTQFSDTQINVEKQIWHPKRFARSEIGHVLKQLALEEDQGPLI